MRRERNGVRKLCKHTWTKCSCAWHLAFQHSGDHIRVSLDRVIGRLVKVTKNGKTVWARDLGSLGPKITSKTEAEAEAERLRTAIRSGAFNAAPAPPQMDAASTETLESFARAWLKTAPARRKASTVRFYTDHLENHIFPLLGTRPVAEIDRRDVKALFDALWAKKLRPTTTNGIVRTLSVVLSAAVDEGVLAANHAFRPGRLAPRDPDAPKKKEIDPYTREEVLLLEDAAREHFPEWHPFLLCALRTGLRLGELRALQWGDVDWRNGFIRVERNFVEGKVTTPKNGKSRKVDASPQLQRTLQAWQRRQQAEWLKLGLPQPEWIFPSSAGTPLDDSKIRKAILAITKKAKVRRRSAIVHVMRHTFASLLIAQGEPLTYVRDQMGHSSIQITVDVYGHLVPGGNRAAVARLDGPAEVANDLQTASDGQSADAENRQIA